MWSKMVTPRSLANPGAPVIFLVEGWMKPGDGAVTLSVPLPVGVQRQHWILKADGLVGASQALVGEGDLGATLTAGTDVYGFQAYTCVHPQFAFQGTVTASSQVGATVHTATAQVGDKLDKFCRMDCFCAPFDAERAHRLFMCLNGMESEIIMDMVSKGFSFDDLRWLPELVEDYIKRNC
jgi:hypothetical protein